MLTAERKYTEEHQEINLNQKALYFTCTNYSHEYACDYTIAAHNAAQNSSDNFPCYRRADNQH